MLIKTNNKSIIIADKFINISVQNKKKEQDLFRWLEYSNSDRKWCRFWYVT